MTRGPTLSCCLSRPLATGKRPRRGRPEGLYWGRGLPKRARAQNSASLAETPDPGPAPRNGRAAATTGPGRTPGTGCPFAAARARSRPNSHPRPVCPRLAPRHGKATKDKARKAEGTYLAEAVPERKTRSALLLAVGRQDSTASLPKPCPKAAAATPPPRRRLLQLLGGGDYRYRCGYPGSAALAPPRGGVGPPLTVPVPEGTGRGGFGQV